MDLKSKIILIAGPTASGKSKFAIKFAKKINGEIINADSMQVYKELSILTARPKKEDLKKIKHHLYGFQTVKRNFSTGNWRKLVKTKIKQIKKKKMTPILVGGTGLYFKALTHRLVKMPKIPLRFRNNIRKLHKKKGQSIFHKELIKLDPLAKNKINPNDAQRSIRAYEIKKYSKKSIFKFFKETNNIYFDKDFFKIYIEFPRSELIKRINKRVDKIFKDGVTNEVKSFLKYKVNKDKSVAKVIGLNEIEKYLKKELNLSQTKELISIKTRQYAKRQTTWARGQMSNWQKIDYKDLNSLLKKI